MKKNPYVLRIAAIVILALLVTAALMSFNIPTAHTAPLNRSAQPVNVVYPMMNIEAPMVAHLKFIGKPIMAPAATTVATTVATHYTKRKGQPIVTGPIFTHLLFSGDVQHEKDIKNVQNFSVTIKCDGGTVTYTAYDMLGNNGVGPVNNTLEHRIVACNQASYTFTYLLDVPTTVGLLVDRMTTITVHN